MSLRQSFLFNTLFALIVNFIIKPIWVFGIDRSVQNQIGGEEYGLYFAIFNYVYIFQILLDFGLQNFNQTEIAADNSKFKQLLPGMLSAKLVLTIAYVILTVFVGYLLGYSEQKYFGWLIINQIILSFIVFLRSNISAHRLFIKDAFLSVIDKSLMVILSTLMFFPAIPWIDLSIQNFIWIQTISMTISAIFCVYFNLKLADSFVWRFDKVLFKSILLKAVPFALIYFLMTIYYRIDTVMIEQMLKNGAKESAIYAQSYRILESVNNIGYIVAGVLLPLFAYRLKQIDHIQQVLRQGFGLMFTIIVPIVIGGTIFSKEIIHTLYPNDDPTYSSEIFTVLLLNFIPVGLLYVLGPLLTANKSFKVMIPSLIIASLMNIAINYFFIPQYGALGASIATVSTQVFMLIVYGFAVFYLFELKVHYQFILQSISFLLVVYAMNYLLYQTGLFWLIALGISGTSSLVIAYLLKIISKETLALKIH
ncbi:MAG TPA: polysaccharide biosynthesis C-terminal domain-containing protein [Chitinophagales bacterium]|nr:polysaccharide biosynthesis C-terminal domain-containing protein [Chitinophagales bacterium]